MQINYMKRNECNLLTSYKITIMLSVGEACIFVSFALIIHVLGVQIFDINLLILILYFNYKF